MSLFAISRRDIIALMNHWFALSMLVLCVLPVSAFDEKYAPLPDKVVEAKTVFLQNDSGEQSLTDQVYREIEQWGRWKVVTNRTEADIVIRLERKPLDSKDRFRNNFYLSVLDGRTSEVLLTLKRNKALGRTGDVAKELVLDLKKRMPPPEGK